MQGQFRMSLDKPRATPPRCGSEQGPAPRVSIWAGGAFVQVFGRRQRRDIRALRRPAFEKRLQRSPHAEGHAGPIYEQAGELINRALKMDPENTMTLAWAAHWQVYHVGQGWKATRPPTEAAYDPLPFVLG
jgi:hypothetical protein